MGVGISLACYIPYVAVCTQVMARWARSDGYDFIQALPFKGAHKVTKWPLEVRYIEQAWNRNTATLIPDKPSLRDRLMFSSPKRLDVTFMELQETENLSGRTPQVISHSARPDPSLRHPPQLVEIYQGLGLTVDEIAVMALTTGLGLVFDTWHVREEVIIPEVRRPSQLMPVSLGDWREVLAVLGPYIRVAHLQPRRDGNELEQVLQGKPTEFEEMIRAMLHYCSHLEDFVVEATIGYAGFNPKQLRRTMRDFGQRVREILAK